LKDGKGGLSVESGVLSSTPYTFAQRFEAAAGTNPEELIAAAHSGCFSMALSADLEKAGLTPESVTTQARLTFELKDGKPTITTIHLDCTAKVPGATPEQLKKIAEGTKVNCPVSRALNATLTLDARLA
jgi:osmotically inducible protein OsmC